MSVRNNYAIGEKLPASDVNNIVDLLWEVEQFQRRSMIAGETLDGSPVPVAVYQKASDAKMYKADANDAAAMGFVGFVLDDGIADDDVTLQVAGIVPGFSGLTVGAEYFVSDTAGSISATPGTQRISVGVAVATTLLLIRKKPLHAYGNASDVDVTASGTANNDETITLGFKPRWIKLTFWMQGHTTTNSSNEYVQKMGEAIYDETTLKLCRAFNDITITGADNASGNHRPAMGGINTTASIGSGSGGSGAGGQANLSINSVTATGFVLRKQVINQSSSFPTRIRCSWEAKE